MAKFTAGDRVYFHGSPAIVKQVIREPDADYILDVQGDEFYAEDGEVTSRNAVVAKALNACGTARNARLVPFVKESVKPGDSVWYKGREFNYVGSAGLLTVRIEDIFDGEVEIVSVYDKDLKMSANSCGTARNAMVKIEDAEGAKRWDSLWRKVADLKREAEALDKYLVSKKQYGYSGALETLARALTGL